MRHLRNALHLLVTGLLLCSAGAALADLPPFKTPAAPIECPADNALENAICSDDSLMSAVQEAELIYLLETKARPHVALAARVDWHSAYRACASLEPYRELLRACIKGAFTSFAKSLQARDELSPLDSRDTLFRELSARIDDDFQEAKKERAKCLVGAALELDDGTGLVALVARRVSSRCEAHAVPLIRAGLIRSGLELPFVRRPMSSTPQQVAALSPTLGNPTDAIAVIEHLRRLAARR